ncbi:MAG: serine hydrolase domain-containing protein [Fodinibius sp.]|nr:serine hydrolase domain-containing protein [Fodinibius sp.]
MSISRYSRLAVIVFVVTAGLTTSAGAQSKQPAGLESLKSTVDSLLTANDIAGAGIALVHKDSMIWSGGIGYANYEQKKRATADQLFRAGSISKSFVAMGIMQLVEEGRLKP